MRRCSVGHMASPLRQRRGRSTRSDAEALAAAGAAPLQHEPATLRRHAGPESVRALAPPVAGLIRALHVGPHPLKKEPHRLVSRTRTCQATGASTRYLSGTTPPGAAEKFLTGPCMGVQPLATWCVRESCEVECGFLMGSRRSVRLPRDSKRGSRRCCNCLFLNRLRSRLGARCVARLAVDNRRVSDR